MLKDSWWARLLIRAIIFWLQSIGPLSLAYTLLNVVRLYPRLPWNTLWRKYTTAEAGFFIFFICYARHLQREAKHPPMRSRKQREELSDKVRSEMNDPEKFLSGWFRGASMEDIGREELKRFINWSFWDGRAKDHDSDEIEENVKKIEGMMSKPFRAGWGKAKSLRLTLDPIVVEARSLLWYSIIMGVDTLALVRLRMIGLKYYRTTRSTWAVFPPRPAVYPCAQQKSVSSRLSYWLSPHTSQTKLPIVYLHGIGIGLFSYVEFLRELNRAVNPDPTADDQVGLLAIEVLQISSRLTTSIPTRDEFIADLKKIFAKHGWDRFVLCAHSYGSVLSTHILSDADLSSRVSAALLVDPVSILLHMPDVAYNFTLRPPVRANEWILWYFASKDPGVAHTLGRHFFWYENVLWRDRIMHLVEKQNTRFTISLASDDLIVDTNAVGAYLEEYRLPDPVVVEDHLGHERMELQPANEEGAWKHRPWRGTGLDFLWWKGYDHAEVYDSPQDRRRLIEVLAKYCDGV